MRRAACVALIGSMALGGCVAVATYPPDDGAGSMSGPKTEPIPTLMAEAISYVNHRSRGSGDFAINLPPGTPASVYDTVIRRIGGGHPMEDPDDDRAYHVTKVRLRGRHALVDIFYPDGDGHRFATVSLEGDLLAGFSATNLRVWHIAAQPPPPYYWRPDAFPEDEIVQPILASPGP